MVSFVADTFYRGLIEMFRKAETVGIDCPSTARGRSSLISQYSARAVARSSKAARGVPRQPRMPHH